MTARTADPGANNAPWTPAARNASAHVHPPGPGPADAAPDPRKDEIKAIWERRVSVAARVAAVTGFAAGTALAVCATRHNVHVPGLAGFAAGAATWLLLVIVAVTTAELLRRHHRTLARHAGQQSRRGAVWALFHAGRGYRRLHAKAQARWADRQGTADDNPEPFAPAWVTFRSISGKRLDPDTGEPVVTVTATTAEQLKGMLDRADKDPDLQVTVSNTPPAPPIGKAPMADTKVYDDSQPRPAPARRAGRRYGGAGNPAGWRTVVTATAEYEPETDGDLLTWMAAETNGMTSYAEALTDVYETCVEGLGVDPAGMQALHDVADAVAEAAGQMATARRRFADHYAEVREFTANGGLLAHNGRWHTGEGD